jgi:hypothetical protein
MSIATYSFNIISVKSQWTPLFTLEFALPLSLTFFCLKHMGIEEGKAESSRMMKKILNQMNIQEGIVLKVANPRWISWNQ